MLKISLLLIGVALVCLGFADLELVSSSPWLELGRMGQGALAPQFQILWGLRDALLMTLVFALCGVGLGVAGGAICAFNYKYRAVRLFCAVIRSVHEIFWAFLFLPALGLTPICGVLAIAVPYVGIFAKVFSEILQEVEQQPLAGFPHGTGRFSRFLYGIWPLIYPSVRSYTSYRFECGLRSSAVLGFIGLPTLGYHLETAFHEGHYGEAAAMLYLFFGLIWSLKFWLKPKLVPLYLALAAYLLPHTDSIQWRNLARTFFYEILPWPMRRAGVQDGSGSLAFPLEKLWHWLVELVRDQMLPGSIQTLVLTQIVLVASGLIALPLVLGSSRKLQPWWIQRCVALVVIVVRTTPEYMVAFIGVLVVGPSMLPAIAAISMHNGAILGYLVGRQVEELELRLDAPKRRLNQFFYEILPRVYGQFLALLFYRWEVMLRESAILGVLGVHTLGFYIDSSFSEDRLDKAFLLIACTAALNIGVDSVSNRLRRTYKVEGRLRLV